MNLLNDRSDIIRQRLGDMFLTDIGIPVSIIPPDEWAAITTGPGETFGFMWPVEFEGSCIVVYCPEVISILTSWLDDEQFESYMDIIEYMLALHVADVETPVEQRRQRVESDLWDLRPEAMEFLSFVQMQMLDTTQERPDGDDGG